jgi:dihydroorotase
VQKFLLKNGRVIDPSRQIEDLLDLLIEGEKIVQIGRNLKAVGVHTMDFSGLIIAPGFIDMHVHLREPGKEEAETIHTGSLAAAAGGFTAVACMPNTLPVNDCPQITEFILKKAQKEAVIAVHPIAAITRNGAGEELTDMFALKEAGAIALSDDGKPVANSLLLRKAMERAKKLQLLVIDHCEDLELSRGASMNEGDISQELSLQGMPAAAEEIMVARNIIISKLTGAHVHMAHMSTAGSMELIRRAKHAGIRVTCEVTPHHFTLTEDAIRSYGTNAKMNPPLRTAEDLAAVLDAIVDGTVDVIASDHAPHTRDTKDVTFDAAAFGITGLETSVSLGLDRLLNHNLISLNRFVELYSTNAAKILGLKRTIEEGAEADLTIFHPSKKTTFHASESKSKSRNTPFDGWNLKGAPMATIYKGKLVWSHSSLQPQHLSS